MIQSVLFPLNYHKQLIYSNLYFIYEYRVHFQGTFCKKWLILYINKIALKCNL